MPRVKSDDPIFAGFNPSAQLVFPPLFGPAWPSSGSAPDWQKKAFAKANFEQWSNITGKVIGKLAVLDGIPQWSAGGFGTFFSELPRVKGGDVLTASLGGAATIVSLALAASSTAIPILGWVVTLGVGIYEGIKAAIQYAQSRDDGPAPGEAITFSADDNASKVAQIMGAAEDDDWTPMFMPPGVSGRWEARHITWSPIGGVGSGQGWAFGTDANGGLGLVPGMAACLSTMQASDGALSNYQFPNKTPGGLFGAEFDLPAISTAGDLMPSSQQLAILMWQSVMKPSVAMFRVDSFALVAEWMNYYEGLAAFALTLATDAGVKISSGLADAFKGSTGFTGTVERGLNPKLAYNEAISITTYLSGVMSKDGALEILYPTSELSAKNPGALPQLPSGVTMLDLATAGELTYTPADIVRYVCHLHRERADAALRTLVCAYVPPNAPLLRAGAKTLGARHDDMRRLLLNHRAVNEVELDLIPDTDYRAAVSQAQHRNRLVADVGFGAMGPGGAPPQKGKPGQPPTVDGSPFPDMPDSPGPGMPPKRWVGSSGGGIVLPVIGVTAAVAVASWLVLRKRRR